MPKKEIIHFGDQDVVALPMTLGQIEEIIPILAEVGDAPQVRLSSLLKVLQVALEPDNEGFDIRKVRASPADIVAAVDTVLKLSGLRQGEARAPVISTSPATSAPSLSAAATPPSKPGD